MKPAKVAQYKKDNVAQLAKLMQQYPIIGIVNMQNLPAAQLQSMRTKLRKDVLILMSKKPFMARAFENVKAEKPGIEKLAENFGGMPALLFTKENPFKLASIIRKNKSKAAAKPGQTAPFDIIVPAGATPFTPGPIISELSSVGLKTGVEGGKIVIRDDKVVVRAGEAISQKLSGVLAKLGIQPIDIGLDLVAIYDNGTIYGRDVLSVDDQHYIDQIKQAARESLGLAVFIGYPTAESVKMMIGKAFRDAKGLAIGKKILNEDLQWVPVQEPAANNA
ncbi:MAG: 50S ribosomal protein L10 [Candidatus Woesearchaeota archaeon]